MNRRVGDHQRPRPVGLDDVPAETHVARSPARLERLALKPVIGLEPLAVLEYQGDQSDRNIEGLRDVRDQALERLVGGQVVHDLHAGDLREPGELAPGRFLRRARW